MEKNTAFPYIESDLQTLSHANNYQQWLFKLCQPYIGKRVLEIGSGIGNYTQHIIKTSSVWATDCEEFYVRGLENRFSGQKSVKVSKLKLENWDTDQIKEIKSYKPDTIMCLNVLEHVKNDKYAINSMLKCLGPSGNLILIVPAFNFLFSKADVNYGHFKRYSKKMMFNMFENLGVDIVSIKYFNLLGMFGWFWHFKILRRENLYPSKIKLFNSMVPVFKFFENLFPLPFGLSLFVVARSKS